MSGLTPQALLTERDKIGNKLREISSKQPKNITKNERETLFPQLVLKWNNLDTKLHKATLEYIHTLLYNPSSQTVKSANSLQRIINGLSPSNKFNKNTRPILAIYKSYLERIKSNKLELTTHIAKEAELAAFLKKEKNSLEAALNAERAAFEAQIAGETGKAAALKAQANARVAQMQAAHEAALGNMEKQKKLQINKLQAEQLELRLNKVFLQDEIKNAKALANRAATNLAAAKASGNEAAAKAAQLEKNIYQRNVEATERKAQIAAAKAALVQAQQNAETASAANQERARQALENAQRTHAAQLAAVTNQANRALQEARNEVQKASTNKEKALAQAAANKAAADAAAAQAAANLQRLTNEGTATKEALAAAQAAANAAQAKAAQEAANLKRNLAAKSVEANRLAESFASTSGALANSHRRYAKLALQSSKAAAEAREARMKTLAAEEAAAAAKGNASKAREAANAHKAEANAAKQAAEKAEAATQAALEEANAAKKAAATATSNAAAQRQAAEAAAAARNEAKRQLENVEAARVALAGNSTATKAQLNAIQKALNKAHTNSNQAARQYKNQIATLTARANSSSATIAEKNAALQALKAAANANKAAAMKKLQENKNKAVAGLREARSTNRNAANAAAKLWLKAYGGPGGVKVPLFNVRKAAREIEKNYPNILKINKKLIGKALSTSLVYQKNQGQLSRATRILNELGLVPSGTTRRQGLLNVAGVPAVPQPTRPAPPPPPGLSQLNIIRLNGIIKNTPNYGGNEWTNDNKFVLNMMNKKKNSNKVKQARKALNNKKSQSMAIVPVGPVMNVPTGGVGGPLSGRNPIEKQALNRFNRVYREYSENGGVTKARWLNLTNAGQLNRLGKYKNRLKLALNNVATNKNRKNKYNKAVANITNRINKIKGKSTVSPKINPSILNTPAPAPASPSLKNRIEQYRKRLRNASTYNNFKKVRNDPNVPKNVRLNSSIRTLISAREAQEKKRQQLPRQKANIRMVGWVSSEKPNPKRKSNKSNYSMKYIDDGYYIQVNGKYRPVLNYNKNTRTARISLLNKNIQGIPMAQKGKTNVLGLR